MKDLERPLSPKERKILPPALAGSIDFGAVRIVSRWHTPIAAAFNVTVVRGGRIFWANAPDEARTLSELAHLAHELVHVWQYMALRRTGAELLSSRFYRYRLSPDRMFLSYGYEQQAAIVEDWFRIGNGAAARSAISRPVLLEHLERVIATAPSVSTS